MNYIPSTRSVMAALAVITMISAAVLAVVAVPAAEAQQSEASEEEIEARVRAELQARLAQINQQIAERMRAIEELGARDLEEMQRQLEELRVEEARVRELAELGARRAGEMQSRAIEQVERRRVEEMRRAMASAEQAMHRARGLTTLRVRGGCEAFGDTVLDYAEDLGLRDDQIDQIREAQRATRRAAIERNADIEVGEMDLEALYEADEPDLAAVRAKLEELAMLGVDNQMAGLNLRQQVRSILTPEQLEQLEELRGDRNVRVVISGTGSHWPLGHLGC